MKVLLINVLFIAYSTGSPTGLLVDCPGMNRTITLSKETQKSLQVVVFLKRTTFYLKNERKCRLNTAGAACAANVLDFTKTTKVLISRYLDNTYSLFSRTLASLEINKGNNAMQMDMFPIFFRTYPMAARIVRPAGYLLGEFLAQLTARGLKGDKLEFIGYSIGAHVAHFAALRFKELTGQVPARITALDPAGGCFRNLPPSERLNPSAATRVDAIHTNIDGFGMAEPVGHVDFYANGGEFQPSMVSGFILPCFLLCSHIHSILYWILAMQNPDKFIGVRCNSIEDARRGNCYKGQVVSNYVGINTNFNKTGVFYLPTREVTPYYMGIEGLKERKYGANTYLEQVSPDKDMVV